MAPKPERSSKKARLTAARLAAVQVMYQQALTGKPLAELKTEFLQHYVGQKLDGDNFVRPDEAHFLAIIDGAEAYGWQLDAAVDEIIHAAQPERKTDNLEILLRLILRCSAFELKYKTAENAIIINDYINISKAFYNLKEPAFVNAILDRLAKAE